MTQPSPSSLPPENVRRGVIFALLALPAGVIAWDLLWSVGFIASIVAFGVAYLAARLYRLGSGGRVTRSGAIAIAVITIGTLIVAFISGFAIDIVGEYSRVTGASITESLLSPRFWSIVFTSMAAPQSLISLLLAAVFGALGCFSILRNAFRQTTVAPGAAGAPASYALPATDPAAAEPPVSDPTVPAPPKYGVRLSDEPDDAAGPADKNPDKK